MAVESAPIVTEADLKQLLEVLLEKGSVLSDDGKHVPWTPVVDKHNDRLSYNAKQREPEVCFKHLFSIVSFGSLIVNHINSMTSL